MKIPITTKQILLAMRPTGMPTLSNFRTKTIQVPEMVQGEVLIKGMYYSVDPYMRGRMNDTKSYVAPFQVNHPLEGSVVARVEMSNSPDFKEGDTVIGRLPWQEQISIEGKFLTKVDTSRVEASHYLGLLGMTGLTAYLGLTQIGKPVAGETVVVSGAAGAVGSVVGQIAKILGCRVVGIAGSDYKATMLKEQFGFDEVINYKTSKDLSKAIGAACPNGVDIYFDNVGGEISDAVMSHINFHARIPVCGQIALYNASEVPMGPRVQSMLVMRSALMQGFLVSNYQSLFPEATAQLTQWIKEGNLKFSETIVHGFTQLPAALLGLFKGENTGKMMVEA
jgi:NADPH:quinone reductase